MNPNDVLIKTFLKELLADFLGSIVRNVNKVYSDASYDGKPHTPPPPKKKIKKKNAVKFINRISCQCF